MGQSQVGIIAVVLIGIVILAAISWFYSRRRRSRQLRERFGPEYDRVVQREGNQRKGEGVLEWRARKREQLHIAPLSDPVRSDFAGRWTKVQAKFVDDPKGAVSEGINS